MDANAIYEVLKRGTVLGVIRIDAEAMLRIMLKDSTFLQVYDHTQDGDPLLRAAALLLELDGEKTVGQRLSEQYPDYQVHHVTAIEHTISRSGNPTWKAFDEDGGAIYLRQAHREMLTEAGLWEDLQKMAVGDEWEADIYIHTTQDGDFRKPVMIDALQRLTPPTETAPLDPLPVVQGGEENGKPTVSAFITRMERASTKNGDPMWRCLTDGGDQVNVFRNGKDRLKDTFHFFDVAGYGARMLDMTEGDVLDWSKSPIPVQLRRDGDWWAMANVVLRDLKEPQPVIDDGPTEQERADARESAQKWARQMLEEGFFVVDTETTGTGEDAEIVQIAAADQDETPKWKALIRPSDEGLNKLDEPTGRGGKTPSEIHGITAEMLEGMPDFPTIWRSIRATGYLHNIDDAETHNVIAYNADYDVRMIQQELNRHGLVVEGKPVIAFQCLMRIYAAYAGQWNGLRGDWLWHGLADACRREGVEVLDEHDALNDCLMAVRLLKAMARVEEVA